jgi:tol-pal system protein YbgF
MRKLGKGMIFGTPGAKLFGHKGLLVASAFSALIALAPAAQAQNYDRPPADVQEGGYGANGGETATILRVDRLENQVRSLNGQVEQLQFQIKRMEDQLRKFQMDVDARFQDNSGHGARPAAVVTPQKRSDLTDEQMIPASPEQLAQAAPPVVAPASTAPNGTAAADGRRHDAFDPNIQPAAPGAPLALGSPESASRPVAKPRESFRDPAGPLDLTPPALRSQAATDLAPAPVAPALPGVATLEPGAAAPGGAPADPIKSEYDAAADQLKTQHYDAAQQGFAAFLQKNPHSRLIAPATYHLGESYYYQNRHREAAEQFLKIATDYSKSPVAPDAMIKLGVSLNALGAKEQACAFFSEMPRKYPNASAAVKMAAAREAKKASC